MKLHLGCGSIYLKDYINIDAFIDKFADECDLNELELHTTTIDKYYKYGFCEGPKGTIADIRSDLEKLPFNNSSVDEIIMFQVLEHIPKYNVENILKEIYRILKNKGNFIVGVPDIKETAKLLARSETLEDDEWFVRLIYGTQRNKYSHHFCGYTKDILKSLLSKFGFTKFKELPNINFYPSIYIKAIKE